MAQFPSRAELAAAPEKPLPESVFVDHAARIERWEVDPASLPAPDARPNARQVEVVRALFGERVTATAALVCAARELGQLQLSKGGAPTEGLRRYMVGRCGSTLPAVTYVAREFSLPEKVPEGQIWKEVMAAPIKKEDHPKVAMQAGVAIVRRGDRALVAMVLGQTAAETETPLPLKAGTDTIVLRGTVGGPSEMVHGIINQGAHGFAACQPAEAVEPPRFALRCTLAPGDESAWIDVLSRSPKKLLSHTVLSVLARREGARAPYVAAVDDLPSTGLFAQDLLTHLNAARARGRLSPLSLSTEQSAINQRLAGSILGAMHGESDEADRLTLGLMAGWEVTGMVRRGDLLALIASSNAEPGAWLTEALSHPTSRSILLQPDRRVVAVGAASPSPQLGVGAVITTYALFGGADHQADVKQVLARLNEARARRSLPPLTLAAELAPFTAAADRIFQGKQGVEQAMHEALGASTDLLGRSLEGIYFETLDLDALEFPPLLTRPFASVSITITHHRPEGAAWGQYVVMIVPIPNVRAESAQAPLPPRG